MSYIVKSPVPDPTKITHVHFATKQDAKHVITKMQMIYSANKEVTLAHFYMCCGIKPMACDWWLGWGEIKYPEDEFASWNPWDTAVVESIPLTNLYYIKVDHVKTLKV